MIKHLIIVLFYCLLLNMALGQDNKGFTVREGKEGSYLFLSNNIAPEIFISRSINNGAFKNIGTLKKPTSPEEVDRIAGAGILSAVQQLKKLSSHQEAWQYIQSHPDPKDYGLLATEVKFLEGMGIVFVDRDIKSQTKNAVIKYKAELPVRPSDKKGILTGEITLGKIPVMEKPLLNKVIERDSSVIIQWDASVANSPDAMFGEVYKKTGNYGPYEYAGKTFANKTANQPLLNYIWQEKVNTNTQYYYIVIPTTLVGLPGPASDTASAISVNFKNINTETGASASDSVGGIVLKWKPILNTTFYSGILIERSKDAKKGFQVLDTVAATTTSFYDDKVFPGLQYTYRLRLITLRQNILEPSTPVTAMHNGKQSFIEAPENLRAEGRKDGNHLAWTTTNNPQISGYYVYRQHPDSSTWRLVSNLVKDSVFLDSSIKSSRWQYRYTVRSINYDEVKSEQSNIALARIDAPAEINAPAGLQAAVDRQRVLLRWNDQKSAGQGVIAYNVYKKIVTPNAEINISNTTLENIVRNGFIKINTEPLQTTSFTDNNINTGKNYYVVTAMDISGTESNGSLATLAIINNTLITPIAEIYVRSVSKAIVISWEPPAQEGITGFNIYRRTADDNSFTLIGNVGTDNPLFEDTKVEKGRLYIYTVKTLMGKNESKASGEKSVRL